MRQQKTGDWEQVRRGGRLNYVFRYGILRWGLWMVLAMTAYDAFRGRLPAYPTEWLEYLGTAILAYMLVSGTLYGLWTWSANEDRYQKVSQSAPIEGPNG